MPDEVTAIVTGPNLILAAAVFALVATLKASFKELFATKIGQRLLPILPPTLGVIGALLGCSTAERVQDKWLIGSLAGFMAAHVFKLGKTTLLGAGIDEPETPLSQVSMPPAVVVTQPPVESDSFPPAVPGKQIKVDVAPERTDSTGDV